MGEAILYGNGLNLLSENCPSWQELLISISDRSKNQIFKDIPPTLQYEQVYLSPKSTISLSSSAQLDENGEKKLKEAVRKKLSKIKTNEFYDKLLNLGVSIFLTTNYDHAIYDNDEKSIKDRNATEKIYSIKRWKKIRYKDSSYTLFQFHGDMSAVKSIMLGLDHYGGALAKVQDYVKGYFVEEKHRKKTQNKSEGKYSIYRRLTSETQFEASKYGFKANDSGLVSWIDAFFFANLHIIGINLDFSEIDIWWLLSRRARLLKGNVVKNKIYYYPTFPLSEIHLHLPKLRLLERMGVEVVYHKQTTDIEKGVTDYRTIYNEQIDNMSQRIANKKTVRGR